VPFTDSTEADDAFLRRLLLLMGQERSSPELLKLITSQLAANKHVALARIWLVKPGDLCPSCNQRAHCQQQVDCLYLVASCGASQVTGERWGQLNGRFQRFPFGHRKIGHIAQHRQGLTISNVQEDPTWLADRTWADAEGIVGFTGKPLLVNDRVVGVLGCFTRTTVTLEMCEVAPLLANHAAVAIANAQAFEEVDRLRRALTAENELLRAELGHAPQGGLIVGSSAAFQQVVQKIELVAPTPANVSVIGESGTGKELVAREIHRRSSVSDGPLVRLNCAAIPEGLFESEFFGHAKGAFTGATSDRQG
jgi:transcriptional regulator with GAF, ATPase, and Fis domain